MLALPTVTLCCIDTIEHRLALRSLARSCRSIRFGRTILFTNEIPAGIDVPDSIEIRTIGRFASRNEYSEFVVKRLVEHIDTPHVLVTQWDGYVAHPDAWRPEFLDCDYLGAVWPYASKGSNVGNGGFSLRSRRLLEALHDDRFQLAENEDSATCGVFRPMLERDFGIRFGSEDLAHKFSFEMDPSHVVAGEPTFGFHGIFNLFLVESQVEIAALARQLPDRIARTPFCSYLLSNCVNYKQWDAAIAVGTRMLEADPENEKAAELVTAARTFQALARPEETPARRSLAGRVLGRLLRRG